MSGESGDRIDRVLGTRSPTELIVIAFIATAVMFGGTFYAVTAYGPTRTEPATVLGQYRSTSSGTRSICGIEVQIASGEKTRASGGNLCSVYDEGDQAVALVSTLTGDAVGVRHAGRDLGRAGNPLIGLVPIAAVATLVMALLAAGRTAGPVLAKTAGSAAVGGLFGLAVYWLLF